jgi:hypothetical protein
MPAWNRFESRADSLVSGLAVVNDWGFFDLSGTTELWLDGIRTGTSFRVVREAGEKPATRAAMQP